MITKEGEEESGWEEQEVIKGGASLMVGAMENKGHKGGIWNLGVTEGGDPNWWGHGEDMRVEGFGGWGHEKQGIMEHRGYRRWGSKLVDARGRYEVGGVIKGVGRSWSSAERKR